MKKKVLLLIPSLGSGGAERQAVNLALLFQQCSHHVELLVFHKDDFYKDILIKNGIKVNVLAPKNHFDRIFKVRKAIRNSGSDVVICFLENANFLGCVAAIGGKKWKLITTELSCKLSTFNSRRGKVFCWFARYSDAIVCNSYNAMRMWAEHRPELADRLSVIYNPVVMPSALAPYVTRKEGRFNLIVAASYQYLKNPIGLIKAVSLMRPELKSMLKIEWYGRREVVKGDTRAYDESVKLLKEKNLDDIIHLYEETNNIIEKMQSADAVGLFSELEGLPNAICEGMKLGKPIVMTRVSDYQVLVDERNGVLCDWDDPASIKAALEALMEMDDQSLLSLGRASMEKAEQLFSSQTILSRWLALISESEPRPVNVNCQN